uniref:Uncharacterized protein n=1 Tax=Schlesneria paludicola TaxID=360056 RepID=A0A7C2K1I9_9PLAN
MVKRGIAAALLISPMVLCALSQPGEAGWGLFGKSQDDSCEACSTCGKEKEKKCKIFGTAAEPPRAAVVDAIPARFTTARADRQPAPAPAPAVPPVPAPSCTTGGGGGTVTNPVDAQRIADMERDIRELKLQIQALVRHLQDQPSP